MKTLTRYSLPLAGVLLLAAGMLGFMPLRYTLEPASTMRIEGTSSLHDWACTAAKVAGTMQMEAATETFAISRVEVTVPVRAIDCDNGTMDKKTRDALQADAHPTIRYRLDSAEVLPGTNPPRFSLRAAGRLTVAGTERPLGMMVSVTPLADGRYRFTGEAPLTMSDFGVEPPTALLGTLKTGDRVVVRFDVVAALQDG